MPYLSTFLRSGDFGCSDFDVANFASGRRSRPLSIKHFAQFWLWKGIGFGFCGEACPRRVLHPNYTMEGVNLAPMKEEKRLTFHSPQFSYSSLRFPRLRGCATLYPDFKLRSSRANDTPGITQWSDFLEFILKSDTMGTALFRRCIAE
jgi:hypothetical protein